MLSFQKEFFYYLIMKFNFKSLIFAILFLGSFKLSFAEFKALIVGINNYQHISPNLNYAVNDAKDVRKALLSYQNWKRDNIFLLTDSSASKWGIYQAMETIGSTMTGEDTFLFFFSGHGGRAYDMEPFDEPDHYDEYLVTYDAWYIGDGIRDDEFAWWLMALIKAGTKIVAIDACYSGGIGDGELASIKVKGIGDKIPASSPILDDFCADIFRLRAKGLENDAMTIALTSSLPDQLSYETSELKNGVFTYYFTEAFRALVADKDMNFDISAEEAFDFLFPLVSSYPSISQTPTMYDSDPYHYQVITNGYAPGTNSYIHIYTDKGHYNGNETIEVKAEISHPSFPADVDLYVCLESSGEFWFLMPFLPFPSFSLNPRAILVPLSESLETNGTLFSIPLNGFSNPLTLTWYSGIFEPGTFNLYGSVFSWTFSIN